MTRTKGGLSRWAEKKEKKEELCSEKSGVKQWVIKQNWFKKTIGGLEKEKSPQSESKRGEDCRERSEEE